MRRAKVSLVLDEKGGFLIESPGAAVRVYAAETEAGGIYFEFAAERGVGFRVTGGKTSITEIAYPVREMLRQEQGDHIRRAEEDAG